MDEPLVSVIVPVYNTRQYLGQCLDSIINQTYKNLEIILVDDGSTDGSENMCDEYARNDSRIKVIHKKNGGQSDARNAGIDQSQGVYLSYVDSDDFIHKSQIEIMVNIAIAKAVPMVMCGYQKFVDGRERKIDFRTDYIPRDDCIYRYASRDAVLRMLYRKKLSMYSCGNLYDRELFKTLRFPKGKVFEDVPTTWGVMKQVDNIAYADFPLYFYRQRMGSTVHTQYSHKKMDQVYTARDIMNEVVGDHELYKAAVSKYFFCLADIYAQVDNKHKSDKVFLKKELKKYGKTVKKDRNNGLLIRMLSFLGDINILFIRVLGKAYKSYKSYNV